MRIVFMGTPDFAVPTLEALADAGHEIVAAVTQPDKPFGRKAELRPSPVKQAAARRGIPVLQPKKVREESFAEEMRLLRPDVAVVAAFGQIIPQAVLDIPRLGCLNVHASILPAYRGAAPIQWALLNGEKKTGVTIMQMDAGLDTGDMLATCEIEITGEETGGSLFDKLSSAGAALLVGLLPALERGEVKAIPQPADSTTEYARMIRKEDGRIDWSQDAERIARKIRALDPWPGTFTSLEGRSCRILRAIVADETEEKKYDKIDAAPGCVRGTNTEGIWVQTGKGLLLVTELQLEGKKRMPAAEFLRGHALDHTSRFA